MSIPAGMEASTRHTHAQAPKLNSSGPPHSTRRRVSESPRPTVVTAHTRVGDVMATTETPSVPARDARTSHAVIGGISGLLAGVIAAYLLGLLVFLGLGGDVSTPALRIVSVVGVLIIVSGMTYAGVRSRSFSIASGAALIVLAVVAVSLPAAPAVSTPTIWGAISTGAQVLLVPAVGAALVTVGAIYRHRHD